MLLNLPDTTNDKAIALIPEEDYLDLPARLSHYRENSSLLDEIANKMKNFELAFASENFPKRIALMRSRSDRIANISAFLGIFSRTDADEKTVLNWYEGLDRLKYCLKDNGERLDIEIVNNYGKLPLIKYYTRQLNQMFINLFAKAIDALDESNRRKTFTEVGKVTNRITITTKLSEKQERNFGNY